MIKTNDILNELKKSVFGQDDYLKQLAIVGYKHQLKAKLIEDGKEPICSNLLVIGPSGCGKTFSVKQLSKLIDVPFFEVDCSNLVQVGYQGYDTEDAINSLVETYRSKAKNAIVYLDEFDKILDLSLMKDGKGKCQQQNLLKLLEPNVLNIKIDSGRHSTTFDTSGLTFIATGSFEVIKELMRVDNIGKMGFGANGSKSDCLELNENDLIKHGYMPELIGRFSKLININQLNKDDFYNIVKYGAKSSLKVYEELFKEQNIVLNIKDNVYKEMANRSYSSDIGARNISKVINNILDDCLSDVSNDYTIRKITISYKNGEFIHVYDFDPNKENVFKKQEEIKISGNEILNYISELLKDMEVKPKISKEVKKHFLIIFSKQDTIEQSFLNNLLFDNKETSIQELNFANRNRGDFSKTDIDKLSCQVAVYRRLIERYAMPFEEIKEV